MCVVFVGGPNWEEGEACGHTERRGFATHAGNALQIRFSVCFLGERVCLACACMCVAPPEKKERRVITQNDVDMRLETLFECQCVYVGVSLFILFCSCVMLCCICVRVSVCVCVASPEIAVSVATSMSNV